MPGRTTVKGRIGWRAEPDQPPMHLDDLAESLGARLDPIREALAGEADLAVVLAHDLVDGDDFVLVATRRGVHVRHLWPEASHPVLSTQHPGLAPWAAVRVSPVWSEGWEVNGTERSALATHSCEVRIAGTAFLVSANGTSGRWAVDGFHDEVVRRGTPWHYPS